MLILIRDIILSHQTRSHICITCKFTCQTISFESPFEELVSFEPPAKLERELGDTVTQTELLPHGGYKNNKLCQSTNYNQPHQITRKHPLEMMRKFGPASMLGSITHPNLNMPHGSYKKTKFGDDTHENNQIPSSPRPKQDLTRQQARPSKEKANQGNTTSQLTHRIITGGDENETDGSVVNLQTAFESEQDEGDTSLKSPLTRSQQLKRIICKRTNTDTTPITNNMNRRAQDDTSLVTKTRNPVAVYNNYQVKSATAQDEFAIQMTIFRNIGEYYSFYLESCPREIPYLAKKTFNILLIYIIYDQ